MLSALQKIFSTLFYYYLRYVALGNSSHESNRARRCTDIGQRQDVPTVCNCVNMTCLIAVKDLVLGLQRSDTPLLRVKTSVHLPPLC